jgi:hypothetical protein
MATKKQRRTKTKKTKKTKTKRDIKGRGKSPNSDKVKCCMCGKIVSKKDTFIPVKCLKKHGQRGHRICNDCWWSKFAIEGTNHECPGCENDLPLTKVSKKTPETIVISD